MKYWIDEETQCHMCEPDCADEWMQAIGWIGFDYDGYNTAEDLKQLIDELVKYANNARDCLLRGKIFND